MEHTVPKLTKKDCFIPILLSVNGTYCSEIGHKEQVLDSIVPILYLLMVFATIASGISDFFVPRSHLRMEHNVPKLIGQDYSKDCFVPIYLSVNHVLCPRIEKGAYKPAWASLGCISLS